MVRSAACVVVLIACGGDEAHVRDAGVDAFVFDAWRGDCDPATQMPCADGDKCAWIIDSSMPSYVGHTACIPAGTVPVGGACTFGKPGIGGFDNCVRGAVCNRYIPAMENALAMGTCRALCSLTASDPGCGPGTYCQAHGDYFPAVDPFTPQRAGLCDPVCDPLADNDFDGSEPTLTRTGTACQLGIEGCYGSPSGGTPPVTTFTCQQDHFYSAPLTFAVHRSLRPPPVSLNGCHQGYLPLLREMPRSTSVVCVALCSPANCYSGNCGTNDDNRLGAAPHRCNEVDARGSFDTSPGAEHCQFLWRSEIDPATRTFLRSPHSDSVGFCFDHSIYQYDSDMDNVVDMPLPACALLQDGFGLGSNPADPVTYFGAADLGCVDSTRAMATGKPQVPRATPFDDVRPLFAR